MRSVVDLPALLVSLLVAAAITAALLVSFRGENRRRAWLTAAALVVALFAIGAADVLLRTPRETHLSTVASGALIAVLGALGIIRATRKVHMWIRAPLTFVVAFLLLFGGLLLGAAYVSRVLPF